MLKIAIAEDQALVRKSMALLIARETDMQVVAEAGDGRELLAQLEKIRADIVLLDVQMPLLDGFETARQLRVARPELRILMLSLRDDIAALRKAIDAGANGYFTKNAPPEELIQALRRVGREGFYLEQNLSRLMDIIVPGKALDERRPMPYITPREKEVICLSAMGLAGKEVADRLFISLRTVERHKANLMERAGSSNFIGVIIYALTRGLIEPSDLFPENG
ncbi:MAG TPA: response regulator transcription factor [Edaphocola sp.]|nr:response regulator transcription factor [Edaphocola sp.]